MFAVGKGWFVFMATVLRFSQTNSAGEGAILVVEDDGDDFLLLERAFKRAGVRAKLAWAKDGLEAKEYLRDAAAQGRLPSCVVLDLKLPAMDGFDLLKDIRAATAYNMVPVVILSGSSSPVDMARAYRLGAKAYFVKASRLDSLIQMSLALDKQWTGSNTKPPA